MAFHTPPIVPPAAIISLIIAMSATNVVVNTVKPVANIKTEQKTSVSESSQSSVSSSQSASRSESDETTSSQSSSELEESQYQAARNQHQRRQIKNNQVQIIRRKPAQARRLIQRKTTSQLIQAIQQVILKQQLITAVVQRHQQGHPKTWPRSLAVVQRNNELLLILKGGMRNVIFFGYH